MEIRGFRPGDGAGIVELWTISAPRDPITPERFRNLILLDPNFDADGLRVAVEDDRIVGTAYAVRRTVAMVGSNLEPDTGWLLFFFVHPDYRRRGIGRAVVTNALDWLRSHGRREVYFSSYTPNYFLPGLDAAVYPETERLLSTLGFSPRTEAVAMDRSLVGYEVPGDVRERRAALDSQGYRLASPTADELVDLIALAGAEFSADWARAIREAVVGGLPLERIVAAWEPDGTLVGWAMHGTYENVLERFGPFGVLADRRGTGLGKVLLHLTLERMRGLGAHSAWFLWTGEETPAGYLYRATGFHTTRVFRVLRGEL